MNQSETRKSLELSRTTAGETGAGGHVIYFDAIRGLAALTVIASHYVLAYGLPCRSRFWKVIWTSTPLHFWRDGMAAVSLFFVLSGLVLSLKAFRTSPTPDPASLKLGEYLIGRVCRIWIPYFAVMLISLILQRTVTFHHYTDVLPPSDWILRVWKQPASAGAMLNQALLILPGSNFSLVPQAWTLSVELTLSFLIPVLILLAARSPYWLVFFVLFAIRPLGVSYFLFHFALGVLIAQNHRAFLKTMEAKRWLRILLLIGGVLLYTFNSALPAYLFRGFHISATVNYLCTGLGSAMLLLFVMGSPRLQAILSLPWLRTIGKVSYSIYLIHFIVLVCITPWVLEVFSGRPGMFVPAWYCGFAVTIGVTLLLAKVSWRYVEVPGVALGKRLIERKREMARGRALKKEASDAAY